MHSAEYDGVLFHHHGDYSQVLIDLTGLTIENNMVEVPMAALRKFVADEHRKKLISHFEDASAEEVITEGLAFEEREAQDQELRELRSLLWEDSLDDVVDSCKSGEAADINNGGVHNQVDFLVEHMGKRAAIKELKKHARNLS